MDKIQRLRSLSAAIRNVLLYCDAKAYPSAKLFSKVMQEYSELLASSPLETFSLSPEELSKWIAGEDIPPSALRRTICQEIYICAQTEGFKLMDPQKKERSALKLIHLTSAGRGFEYCDDDGIMRSVSWEEGQKMVNAGIADY